MEEVNNTQATEEVHEIKMYLAYILSAMEPLSEGEIALVERNKELPEEERVPERSVFKPTYLVTVVQLPTGAKELAINIDNIEEKIKYILEAYDDSMHLKANDQITMCNLLVV